MPAGAGGRTTFTHVDWSGEGTASVVAHLAGYQLGGFTELTEPYVASTLAEQGALRVVLGVEQTVAPGRSRGHGTTVSHTRSVGGGDHRSLRHACRWVAV